MKTSSTRNQVFVLPRKKQGAPELNHRFLTISRTRLESMFHMPIKDAADQLDICATSLKRVCRSLGINRWPYVKVQKKSEDSSDHAAVSSPQQATDASQASTSPPVSPCSTHEESAENGNSVEPGADCLEQGDTMPRFTFSSFEPEFDLSVDPSFVHSFMSRNQM
mmetsp:Transcript_5265/g.12653  ORF Transcript_5265/g.12653 Transcript_5265/m.12653 type:complete len:165 (-) Transcript_5265:186-680(-)